MEISKLHITCHKRGPMNNMYTLGLQLVDSDEYEGDAITDLVKMEEDEDNFTEACDWAISELKDAVSRFELLKKEKNPASVKVQEKINDKKFDENLPSWC
jgi:hypothetical protein